MRNDFQRIDFERFHTNDRAGALLLHLKRAVLARRRLVVAPDDVPGRRRGTVLAVPTDAAPDHARQRRYARLLFTLLLRGLLGPRKTNRLHAGPREARLARIASSRPSRSSLRTRHGTHWPFSRRSQTPSRMRVLPICSDRAST